MADLSINISQADFEQTLYQYLRDDYVAKKGETYLVIAEPVMRNISADTASSVLPLLEQAKATLPKDPTPENAEKWSQYIAAKVRKRSKNAAEGRYEDSIMGQNRLDDAAITKLTGIDAQGNLVAGDKSLLSAARTIFTQFAAQQAGQGQVIPASATGEPLGAPTNIIPEGVQQQATPAEETVADATPTEKTAALRERMEYAAAEIATEKGKKEGLSFSDLQMHQGVIRSLLMREHGSLTQFKHDEQRGGDEAVSGQDDTYEAAAITAHVASKWLAQNGAYLQQKKGKISLEEAQGLSQALGKQLRDEMLGNTPPTGDSADDKARRAVLADNKKRLGTILLPGSGKDYVATLTGIDANGQPVTADDEHMGDYFTASLLGAYGSEEAKSAFIASKEAPAPSMSLAAPAAAGVAAGVASKSGATSTAQAPEEKPQEKPQPEQSASEIVNYTLADYPQETRDSVAFLTEEAAKGGGRFVGRDRRVAPSLNNTWSGLRNAAREEGGGIGGFLKAIMQMFDHFIRSMFGVSFLTTADNSFSKHYEGAKDFGRIQSVHSRLLHAGPHEMAYPNIAALYPAGVAPEDRVAFDSSPNVNSWRQTPEYQAALRDFNGWKQEVAERVSGMTAQGNRYFVVDANGHYSGFSAAAHGYDLDGTARGDSTMKIANLDAAKGLRTAAAMPAAEAPAPAAQPANSQFDEIGGLPKADYKPTEVAANTKPSALFVPNMSGASTGVPPVAYP